MLGEVHDPLPPGEEIGRSRRGRPILAYRIGRGPLRVSLIGGCHADEPVGPRFLGRLVRFLAGPAGSGLRRVATWSVIPHVNPDGADCNAAWQTPGSARYDLVSYLRHRVRELPGDDIEFGFPHGAGDEGARPENRAAWQFWQGGAPFDLHVSMHGMSAAAGPYFLVERSWWQRRWGRWPRRTHPRGGRRGVHPARCGAASVRRDFTAWGAGSAAAPIPAR